MPTKINIIITAYKEPISVVKAIKNMQDAIVNCYQPYNLSSKDFMITVCAPDEETINAALDYEKDNNSNEAFQIEVIKDLGVGKPAALNLCFGLNKSEIVVLTDGDVYVCSHALKNLLMPLLKNENNMIGAISGRPVSINNKNTQYGFWSHLLTDMADKVRTECVQAKNSIVCSGYLYAIKFSALSSVREGIWIDEDILSDDAYLSYAIEKNGYIIDYASNAKVFVKYPTNFKDWIDQKARSTGGYNQLKKRGLGPKNPMRSFKKELQGLGDVWGYGKGLNEKTWTLNLILARSLLWTRIIWERNLIDKNFKETWNRIESTK